MKTTTYKIGQNGHGAPNEKISSMETFNTDFINKLNSEEEIPKFDKNSRRCDPDNPNRERLFRRLAWVKKSYIL